MFTAIKFKKQFATDSQMRSKWKVVNIVEELSNFKFVLITSCDVKCNFSAYKSVLNVFFPKGNIKLYSAMV